MNKIDYLLKFKDDSSLMIDKYFKKLEATTNDKQRYEWVQAFNKVGLILSGKTKK